MRVYVNAKRGGGGQVILDDKDITRNISADGVLIDLSEPRMPRVILTLLPEEFLLDADVIATLQRAAEDEHDSGEGEQ